MPTLSHAVPTPKHNVYDLYGSEDVLTDKAKKRLKETNKYEEFEYENMLTNNNIKKLLEKTFKNEVIVKNKNNSESKTSVTEEIIEFEKKLHTKVLKETNAHNINRLESFGIVNDGTVDDRSFIAKDSSRINARCIDEVEIKHKESVRNKTVLESKGLKSNDESNKNNTNHIVKERKRDKIEKSKWPINLGVLVTLVILNGTSQGDAAEVITTNSLASLLGYEGSCWLGAEEHPCTLAIACWLRGGTSVRGCGGWLFACCQPPSNTPNENYNNVPSSDWTYQVSPPRLRQVPQRNVMPNNVFRRRVDDDVTHTDCGVPSNRILQKRIIGGREARFAEFPWQAHVRISEFQCGGVLVSQWYVATAAHCVSRAHIRDIVVWLGALDTSAGSRTARKVGVNQKILHPLFQFRMTQPDRFDIALLKLARPISFTRHIRAICLPDSAMPLRGRSAVIAGWGKTDATDTHTGTNMLRSATVPILSKEQCIAWHQSKQISVEIHSEMICAGHSDGHQDACLGDSGGPLIVPESGRYYLVGITSAGFGCGVDHQPGIYHNVQVTASWIRRVVNHEDTVTHGDTMILGDTNSYYDRSNYL